MAKASKVARYNLLQAFNDIYSNTYSAYQSLVLWMEMTSASPTDTSNNASTTVSYENTPIISQVVFGPDSIQKYWSATFSDATNTNAVALNTDGNFCFTSLASLGTPTATSDRPFSISFWAKITPVSVAEYLFAKQYTGVTNSYEYKAYWQSGQIYFLLKDMDSARFMGRRVDATSWTGAWHHFVFTYDGGGSAAGYPAYSEGLRIYVDGAEVVTINYSQSGYVGMKPNFSGALYVGTNEISSLETDAQMAEFVVWSKQLSATEIKAIYNASLYGSAKLLSGFLNNPPRTILQARDNATGSYPTVSRIGDPGRTGRYAVNFNDTSTVVFNSDVTVSYPTDLQLADSAYISQPIATPSTNATIQATGTVRKGVSDANITFTPGEDLKPFVEDRLYASTPEAFTDPFYMTGSTVSDVGLGFTNPLRSKTKIEIDLAPIASDVFGFISGSDPVHASSAQDLSEDPNVWPMVYYNFNERKFQKIGFGMPSTTVGGAGGTRDVKSMLIKSGAIGFSRGTELISEGLDAQCRPISSFGFPSDTRYHATSSHLYPMSGVLNRPFLVEKFVYEFKAAYFVGTDVSTRDAMFRPSGAAIVEDRTTKGRASIMSFFILNQRSPMNVSYPTYPTINLNNGGGSSAASISSVSFPILIPSRTQLVRGEPYTNVDTYRDLVSYGQATIFTPGTSDTAFMNEAISTGGLGREVNINVNAATAPMTASFVMSGTVKTTPAFTSGPVYRISKWPDHSNDKFVISTNYQGTRPGIKLTGTRGLTSNTPGATISGSMQDFGITTSGQGTSDSYTITTFEDYDIVSPYLLKPEDNLIFGWQVPMPMGWRRASDGGTGPNMQVLPGKGKLTLYGSLVSDHKEHHDGLNQPLTSDAVHEFIGFHGPPLDQWDTEPRQQFSGSMISNVVTGSIAEDRKVVGEKSNGVWSGGQATVVASIVVSNRNGSLLRPGSFNRFMICASLKETFFDSYVPDIGDMVAAEGLDLATIGNSYWFVLGRRPGGVVVPAFESWFRIFPFEARFNSLPRNLSVSYSKRQGYDFGGPYVWVPTTTPPGAQIILGEFPNGEAVLANASAVNRLAFGIGNGPSGSVDMFDYGTGTYGFSGVRGFKYGIRRATPENPQVHFRPSSFGQFRDMLEQRPDTRFLISKSGRLTRTSAPIISNFVSVDGSPVTPSKTSCSNLNQHSTSSLPYFDGVARNRGPIVPTELGMTVVSV